MSALDSFKHGFKNYNNPSALRPPTDENKPVEKDKASKEDPTKAKQTPKKQRTKKVAPPTKTWSQRNNEEQAMTNKVQEGLADLADMAERDHEVQMARADLYKIAKYAIKLHDMLKNTSEAEGIEGWMQSKITKAADYMGSVFHTLDYDQKFGEEVTEARDTHCSDKCCGSDVKAEDCNCPADCPHCNCNAKNVEEGKSPHKKGSKKYKAHMAAMHAESKKDEYKSSLHARLAERSLSKDEVKKKKRQLRV